MPHACYGSTSLCRHSTWHSTGHRTDSFQKIYQLCAWHNSALSYTVYHTYSTLKTRAMLMNARIYNVEHFALCSMAPHTCGDNVLTVFQLTLQKHQLWTTSKQGWEESTLGTATHTAAYAKCQLIWAKMFSPSMSKTQQTSTIYMNTTKLSDSLLLYTL